jgi:hypothetical protein
MECFNLCLEEGVLPSRKDCINLLAGCAIICNTAALKMSMSAVLTKEYCQLCAQICNDCAMECSKFEDDYTLICADICRRCAEECAVMLAN